jgi:protein TonB
VGSGVYSRPRAVNVVAKETLEIRTPTSRGSDRVVVVEPGAEADRRSSRKTKLLPPPPPPAVPIASEPPAPPSAPSRSTPSLPPSPPSSPATSLPAQPVQPATPAAEPDKTDKNKTKAKNKDKVKGELIEAPPPVYPEEARKQKIEGTVAVTITIGNDGNVIFAKARSGPEALYGAAEAAASKARFKPTTVNEKPAKVAAVMTYNFVLDKKE